MHKADLLLHPIRLRIATELVNRTMTPAQLAEALPDIPQATLYRHIKLLYESGLIEVAREQSVNGAVERTYQFAQGGETLTLQDAEAISPSQHMTYFNRFMGSLIETFARYLNETKHEDIGQDGMSYNRAVIYLTPQERVEFQKAILSLVNQFTTKPPTEDRNRFTLASIVIPDERKRGE